MEAAATTNVRRRQDAKNDTVGIRGDRRDRRRAERAGAQRPWHVAWQGQGVPAGRSSPAASTTRAASTVDEARRHLDRRGGQRGVRQWSNTGRRDVLPRRRRREHLLRRDRARSRACTTAAEARRHGAAVVRRQATGDSAIGASRHHRRRAVTSVGLIGGGGGPTIARSSWRSHPAAGLFGHIVKIDPWNGKVRPFADFAAVRRRPTTRTEHEEGGIDSDSYGLLSSSRRLRRRGRGRQRRARRQCTSRSRRWPCSRTCWCLPRRSSSRPRRAG